MPQSNTLKVYQKQTKKKLWLNRNRDCNQQDLFYRHSCVSAQTPDQSPANARSTASHQTWISTRCTSCICAESALGTAMR